MEKVSLTPFRMLQQDKLEGTTGKECFVEAWRDSSVAFQTEVGSYGSLAW